jgi:Holliday junction resolvase RusA-like endonuclease
MMELTVELPLPPRACSPNGRHYWRVKSAAVKNYRSECAMAYRAAWKSHLADKPLISGKVTVSLEFWQARPFKDGRARFKDVDNAVASMKAALDALKEANVIADDRAGLLSLGSVELHGQKDSAGRCCVVLTLKED